MAHSFHRSYFNDFDKELQRKWAIAVGDSQDESGEFIPPILRYYLPTSISLFVDDSDKEL